MRLPKEYINKISELIVKNLTEKELALFKVEKQKVIEKIEEVITKNLREEDELNREVERLLEAHSKQLRESAVEYRKMFNMIKSKLARERNLIL